MPFLSGFHSANVSSCGEIIEEFEDDIPNLKWTFHKYLAKLKLFMMNLIEEYLTFKNNNQAQIYKKLSTKELLQNFKTKN